MDWAGVDGFRNLEPMDLGRFDIENVGVYKVGIDSSKDWITPQPCGALWCAAYVGKGSESSILLTSGQVDKLTDVFSKA